ELLTRVPEAEISVLRAGHPMEAKKRLAGVITAQYHGDRAAVEAADRFARVHQHREDPEEIEKTRVAGGVSPVWRGPRGGGLGGGSEGGRAGGMGVGGRTDDPAGRSRGRSSACYEHRRDAGAGEGVPDPGGQATVQARTPGGTARLTGPFKNLSRTLQEKVVNNLTRAGSLRIFSRCLTGT